MISVIVPLTSDEKWWKRCISSLEQQGDQVEIICVHSSQSEETTKLKASDQISLVAAQGASFSELCAAGLEQAQGEFVAFVRGCDRWMPHFIEGCERGLSKEDVDIVVTEVVETGDSDEKKSMDVAEVKAATNSTRFLFNLFKIGDIPWNKIYRRNVLDIADLRAKPLSERATGRLIELTAFARARQCSLATRAEYQVLIDKSRIGDALSADEEFAMVMDSIEALDISAGVWEELGLMKGRETEFLDNTQPIIGRAYYFGRIHFFAICQRFHAYFSKHFKRTDLDKTKMEPLKRYFLKSLDVIGSKRTKYHPVAFFSLLNYTTRLNFAQYFKTPSEAKEEFIAKREAKKNSRNKS